jgi:ATP-binding cassette subfamily B (MDR/TAP) protein 1
MWAVMSLYHLYNPLIWMTRAAAAASEVFEILDGPVSNKTGFTPPDPSIFQGDLVFRNVEFSYPSRPDSLILNQLNVVFESGQVTAIVGPSGSGKSTIVGLIERWYEPSNIADKTLSKDDLDSTHEFDIFFREKYETISLPSLMAAPGIYIADVDLKDLDIKWWRSNIGLVQQEPFLFNDTIFQNVANGLSGTKWEHAEYNIKMKMVQDACCQAFADEFISQLPQGFNTSVGEGGMRLSGGQRQRLAIARAIVKSPAILILDEATSAIDVRSERIVQQALDRASKGRTTIVIAHRLSTIRKANKILVVKDGIVVEEGTHAQLLQHGGAYSGLVRAQEVVNTQGEDTDSELTIEGEDSDLNHQVETLKISSHSDSGSQKDKAYREKGFVRSLGFLVLDIPSKRTKALLMLTLVGAVGGGGKSIEFIARCF